MQQQNYQVCLKASEMKERLESRANYRNNYLNRLQASKNLVVNSAIRKMKGVRSSNQNYQDEEVHRGKNSISLHSQFSFNKDRKQELQVNPEITRSHFFIKILSPNSTKSKSKRETNMRKNTFNSSSKRSNSSHLRTHKTQNISPEEQKYRKMLQSYEKYLSDEKVLKRLSKFSKQANKSNIRIYKEDIHKIIVHRYGKDRITTFLQTQYIQDFDSVMKTMKDLFKLKKEEMLIFVFLIIDANKDGVITPDDLNELVGTKRQNCPNSLVMKDAYQILRYVNQQRQIGRVVCDSASNPIVQNQGLTLMKFRIFNYKKNKNDGFFNRNRNKLALTNRMHQHLFSLQKERETSELKKKFDMLDVLAFIKQKSLDKSKFEQKGKFSINFNTFSQIFADEIPRTFVDFLYVYGGVEHPDEIYTDVDESVIYPPPTMKKHVEEISRYELVMKNILEMKDFKTTMKTLRYKTQ